MDKGEYMRIIDQLYKYNNSRNLVQKYFKGWSKYAK